MIYSLYNGKTKRNIKTGSVLRRIYFRNEVSRSVKLNEVDAEPANYLELRQPILKADNQETPHVSWNRVGNIQ
jgi:hypothetical protein